MFLTFIVKCSEKNAFKKAHTKRASKMLEVRALFVAGELFSVASEPHMNFTQGD